MDKNKQGIDIKAESGKYELSALHFWLWVIRLKYLEQYMADTTELDGCIADWFLFYRLLSNNFVFKQNPAETESVHVDEEERTRRKECNGFT